MIHSSYYRPRVYPYNSLTDPIEIDRLQELSGTTTLNREKINEIGRDGTVGWKESIPEVSLTLRQLEYGTLDFWNMLANKDEGATTIAQTDFNTAMVDIAAFRTDDDATVLGTVWYPKLRTSGFGWNLGDPDSLIERNFTLVGEDDMQFTDDNKYVIYLEDSDASAAGHSFVIGSGGYANWPTPVALPDESGSKYFLRCLKTTSGGVTSALVEGTDYTYDGSGLLTFPSSADGDTYRMYYTATTYVSGLSMWSNNTTDSKGLNTDTASIYLVDTSNYAYRLQSASIDVSFDRQDVKEIGNNEVVARGVRERTVRITLGRLLESNTIENLMRGADSSTYGQYSVRKYIDSLTLLVKFYSDNDKGTFLYGLKFTNLSPVSQDAGIPTKDYVSKGTVLEGEEFTISSVEGTIA